MVAPPGIVGSRCQGANGPPAAPSSWVGLSVTEQSGSFCRPGPRAALTLVLTPRGTRLSQEPQGGLQRERDNEVLSWVTDKGRYVTERHASGSQEPGEDRETAADVGVDAVHADASGENGKTRTETRQRPPRAASRAAGVERDCGVTGTDPPHGITRLPQILRRARASFSGTFPAVSEEQRARRENKEVTGPASTWA